MIIIKTKKCNYCERDLPLNQFSKNKNNKDNLSYYCKTCMKEKRNLYFYNQGNKKYEYFIIDELRNYPEIQIDGIDYDKIYSTKILLYDLPGVLNNLLHDLPKFLIKYNFSFEEYKFFVQQCKENKFEIKPKDLNT